MRIFLRFHLFLWLTLASASDAATRIQVSECLGSHGERVFSDTDCVGASVREWSLVLPASAPPVEEPKAGKPFGRRHSRSRRPAHATDSRRSYLCTAGAQSWYQHSPCRGIGEKGVAVRQSQVPREQACREIARPAALLRGGSQRDERAGPYARAMGRDPCR